MLSTLITSRARRTLLTLFLTHPNERFYQQQLIRDLGLSSSLVQAELKRLEHTGLLISCREANARYFTVNKAFPIYPELKSIVFKTIGLADFLRSSFESLGSIECALIYGSVAKNIEDARSDVDVLVIGEVDFDALDEALDPAESEIGREINTTVFTRKEWNDRIDRGQSFTADILAGPKIFLVGGEDELRRIVRPQA